MSQWDFSHGKFVLPSLGKASCDRVALPNLRCMQGVLVFPKSTELWHGLRNIYVAHGCKCMRLHTGMYGHRKRVCIESWLWEKNPLPHRGIELASAACPSDSPPTELHPHPCCYCDCCCFFHSCWCDRRDWLGVKTQWHCDDLFLHLVLWMERSRDSLLVRAPDSGSKTAGSSPGRSGGRMFFSRVNSVCWLLFGVRSISCYRSGTYKTLVILLKVQMTGYTTHAYTLDPAKSESADCAV